MLKNLSDENFTVAMFRAGFLTAVTDENGFITGFNFDPPQNFDMQLGGTAGDDVLVTGNGDDFIYSGEGNDTVSGGDGNDFISGGAGDDIIDGGEGSDTWFANGNVADFSFNFLDPASLEITDNNGLFGTDTVSNIEIFEFADGSYTRTELEDLFSGPDEITGTSGDDTLAGTPGDDVIHGLDGNDILNAGDGNDTLYGDAGADTLYGEAGNDMLNGGADSDTLYGGAGDDVLNGGAALDNLYGNEGADTFLFTSEGLGTGADNIRDLNIAEGDKIDISDLLSGFDPVTDAISDFVHINDVGPNSVISVDANGGGDSFQTVAFVVGVTGLTDVQALVDDGTLIISPGSQA